MKKITLFLIAALFSLGVVKAQNAMDAYRYSKNDLTGTARSVSMGGAFGALGGDISGIAINPAGIGVYRNSEIVTTLNFQNSGTQTELLNSGKIDQNKFSVNFDNLAFVTVFPLNSDVAPALNVGFSYNRLKNFDRKYQTGAGGLSRSLTDHMADISTGSRVPSSSVSLDGLTDAQIWDVWNSQDWLTVLGYNSFLINEGEDQLGKYYYSAVDGLYVANKLYAREKGSVSSYDFNMGTTFSNVLSVGLTLSMTDINYRLYSRYTEEFGDGGEKRGFDMENSLRTDGTGWQVKAGVIVKPVQELRIGVAYHSPTWYNMTDRFFTDLAHDLNGLKGVANLRPEYTDKVIGTYNRDDAAVMDYQYRTPDKWTFSLAGVIGSKAILSADYELTNYGSMKLYDRDGRDFKADPNQFIKRFFRTASTVRVGAEYRFTDRFSGRVGYAWMQSPVKTEVTTSDDYIITDARAVTQYGLDGDAQYITYGLGYKLTPQFYVDVAFVMKSQKDDFYAFDFSDKTVFKTNNFQGLLTVGYKF
ncbi:MAG: outer membrane protein transport protein [Prevotella sp.]|jgi:long-subunit fatty acid transport protein|nr:outer membrane protein transport protein [Prevotella sp.]